MTEPTPTPTPPEPRTFTQDEVDRIVRERLERQANTTFGDYEELKRKAGEASTLEQRLATVETELSTTKVDALRAQIASQHGISTTKGANGAPSPAEVLLTGADEAAMTAQASLYAEAVSDRKKTGNVAPREGATTTPGGGDDDLREATRALFGRTD